MEATYSFETSVDFQLITRRYIPEGTTLRFLRIFKFPRLIFNRHFSSRLVFAVLTRLLLLLLLLAYFTYFKK
jgi:hypothetical protein